MTPKFKSFARKNWLPLAGFSASALVALWFVGRFAFQVIYFNDPRHQDEALKPWMTPRYIVLSYDLPRDVVFEALGVDLNERGPILIRELAEEKNLTLEELTARVERAAAVYRGQNK